ncbi:hypothetical protein [Heyndrickxia acidicola]|uniref:Uncharacterized protein n=1 Tax=Heyndrickxia acidicola TaxID=209389 RepID=A0ABU6MLX4_9BACI|nr:hypothetical protein [Heyndrickxia acidicola]MED1205520.1 hypothetical protein [Heyndrickxia acidicola]
MSIIMKPYSDYSFLHDQKMKVHWIRVLRDTKTWGYPTHAVLVYKTIGVYTAK